jgi:hypothetical protein
MISRSGLFSLSITVSPLLMMHVVFGAEPSRGASAATSVIVNNVALTAEVLTALQRLYPVPIAPGRYWYDAVSGAYGVDGGPVVGQMLPGLTLGGPLRADASRGTSGVFINGRQLTAGETAYIAQACRTPVIPGRYWVTGQGFGGYEGGPAAFSLALCGARQGSGNNGGSSTRTYYDSNVACTSSGILGTITTEPY